MWYVPTFHSTPNINKWREPVNKFELRIVGKLDGLFPGDRAPPRGLWRALKRLADV